jgi:hypothetical protein
MITYFKQTQTNHSVLNLDVNLLKCDFNTKIKRRADGSTSLAYDDVSLGNGNPTNAGQVISRAAGLRWPVGC